MHTPAIRLNPTAGAPALRRLLASHRPFLRSRFLCTSCHITWRGEESDCRQCGMPATSRSYRHRSLLQSLLDDVGASLHPRQEAVS
ncbi:hypothetical protein ACH4PU_30635 [Streptomyces sp. NPDC021100]|uniref:hypothetical protein n=1 Tax=Streptomyces sp. NPDC021100 TaxID=3365114 RepID=UPI003799FFEE